MIHSFNDEARFYDDGGESICRVLVRTDIPVGCQGAQICHASREMGARFGTPAANRSRVAVLMCQGEDELLAAAKRLQAEGAGFVLIEETEFPKGFTALATAAESVLGGPSKKSLAKFRLWGG